VSDCPECKRLRSDYRAATMQQFKLEGKLQILAIQHDHVALGKPIPLVQAAANARTEMRQRIASHEQDAHTPPKS